MRKIKAYTLIEVTVAMLLSAITITICYTAYSLITNYYQSFHQENEENDQILFLKQMMERDIFKSKLCLKEGSLLVLHFDSTTVKYQFHPDCIVRLSNEVHIDSFKLTLNLPHYYFEQVEVLQADTIDQIDFEIKSKKNGLIPLQFFKRYSAQNLMN